MPADRTPTEQDDHRAPEALDDAQTVPPPPTVVDTDDGLDGRDATSGVDPRPTGTEDPVRPEEAADMDTEDLGRFQEPGSAEESVESGDLGRFEEPGSAEESVGSGDLGRVEEPGSAEESVGTTADPGASVAPGAAADEHGRERLVTEPLQFQSRWDDIQAAFVDEPRRSVADADALVAEVIDEVTAAFASARADLEEQWSRGDEASTEDLRQAFRRYRSFFQRLLST